MEQTDSDAHIESPATLTGWYLEDDIHANLQGQDEYSHFSIGNI